MTLCTLPPEFHDFRNFLHRTWHAVGLPDPTEEQYDVAHWMQHGPDREVVQCWRGFGKSWILAAYQNWSLGMDADEVCLTVSAAKKRADDFVQFQLKALAAVPETQHLLPTRGQRRSMVEFDVAGSNPKQAPSVRAMGIDSSSLTGSRGSKVAVDDIETRKNSITNLMRERVDDGFKEIGGSILMPEGQMRVLGTPQIEDSLYHKLPGRGYTTRILPARYPTPDQIPLYGGNLAPLITERLAADPDLAGKPVDNIRFGEKELQRREAEYGRLGFLLQFMLMPVLGNLDRYPLRLSDLIVMDSDEAYGPERAIWSSEHEFIIEGLSCSGFAHDHWRRPAHLVGKMVPYERIVMAVDPSARGSDELGWAIGGIISSQIHILAAGGYKGGSDERTMEKLAMLCRHWKVQTVVAEDNLGGGMWSKLFAPVLQRTTSNTGIDDYHSTGQKELRIIDTLDPLMRSHRVVVNRSVIEEDLRSTANLGDKGVDYQLFYQMSRITADRNSLRHDDRLEAVALLAAYLVDSMDRDLERDMRRREDAGIEEALERFLEHATRFERRGQRQRGLWSMRP